VTIDGIPIGLSDLGVVALIVLFGIGLATGRLYTGKQHDREIARMEKAHALALEDATHERAEWRTEARLNQQAVVELTEQNRDLLQALGPTLADFLDKMRTVAMQVRDEGGDRR
jgi:hypothetical protein